MKKSILITSLLSLLLIVAFLPSAFATNGPHQGPGFAMDTDGCAGCHRAHTGVQARLLKAGDNRYGFCTSCHDGTGANNNVEMGVFEGDADITYENHNSKTDGEAGMGLNGGGFESAVPYTGRWSRSGTPVSLGATEPERNLKRHNVAGDDVNGYAFGGGYTGEEVTDHFGAQEIKDFTCTSCHDPHGTSNDEDGTERYRILKGTENSPVNGKITGPIKSNENAAFGKHDYTRDAYNEGIANFCIACHTQYTTTEGITNSSGTWIKSGQYNAGDGKGKIKRFRHGMWQLMSTNIGSPASGQGVSILANLNDSSRVRLPLEQSNGYTSDIKIYDNLACLTCHQSHGTAASMSTNATVAPANSSTLLRLNNRGVCEACHNK